MYRPHTMAAVYGQLKKFKPEAESIKSYLERVSLYFKANAIAAEKQVPILLSSIGSTTYTLLSDLLAPTAPGDKSFEDISATLKQFQPQQSTIAERFHFHKREQAVGETVAEFDTVLMKLVANCRFEDTLQDTLRDHFVFGLRHESIQRRLLSETSLTYSKALETAETMETADKEARAF